MVAALHVQQPFVFGASATIADERRGVAATMAALRRHVAYQCFAVASIVTDHMRRSVLASDSGSRDKKNALLECPLVWRADYTSAVKGPVGSCTGSHARSAAMPRSKPARCPRSDRTGVRCRSTAGSWSRECLFFAGRQPERRNGSCLRAGWQATRSRPGSPPA